MAASAGAPAAVPHAPPFSPRTATGHTVVHQTSKRTKPSSSKETGVPLNQGPNNNKQDTVVVGSRVRRHMLPNGGTADNGEHHVKETDDDGSLFGGNRGRVALILGGAVVMQLSPGSRDQVDAMCAAGGWLSGVDAFCALPAETRVGLCVAFVSGVFLADVIVGLVSWMTRLFYGLLCYVASCMAATNLATVGKNARRVLAGLGSLSSAIVSAARSSTRYSSRVLAVTLRALGVRKRHKKVVSSTTSSHAGDTIHSRHRQRPEASRVRVMASLFWRGRPRSATHGSSTANGAQHHHKHQTPSSSSSSSEHQSSHAMPIPGDAVKQHAARASSSSSSSSSNGGSSRAFAADKRDNGHHKQRGHHQRGRSSSADARNPTPSKSSSSSLNAATNKPRGPLISDNTTSTTTTSPEEERPPHSQHHAPKPTSSAASTSSSSSKGARSTRSAVDAASSPERETTTLERGDPHDKTSATLVVETTRGANAGLGAAAVNAFQIPRRETDADAEPAQQQEQLETTTSNIVSTQRTGVAELLSGAAPAGEEVQLRMGTTFPSLLRGVEPTGWEETKTSVVDQPQATAPTEAPHFSVFDDGRLATPGAEAPAATTHGLLSSAPRAASNGAATPSRDGASSATSHSRRHSGGGLNSRLASRAKSCLSRVGRWVAALEEWSSSSTSTSASSSAPRTTASSSKRAGPPPPVGSGTLKAPGFVQQQQRKKKRGTETLPLLGLLAASVIVVALTTAVEARQLYLEHSAATTSVERYLSSSLVLRAGAAMHETQKERGLASTYLGGGRAEGGADLEAQYARTDAALCDLFGALLRHADVDSTTTPEMDEIASFVSPVFTIPAQRRRDYRLNQRVPSSFGNARKPAQQQHAGEASSFNSRGGGTCRLAASRVGLADYDCQTSRCRSLFSILLFLQTQAKLTTALSSSSSSSSSSDEDTDGALRGGVEDVDAGVAAGRASTSSDESSSLVDDDLVGAPHPAVETTTTGAKPAVGDKGHESGPDDNIIPAEAQQRERDEFDRSFSFEYYTALNRNLLKLATTACVELVREVRTGPSLAASLLYAYVNLAAYKEKAGIERGVISTELTFAKRVKPKKKNNNNNKAVSAAAAAAAAKASLKEAKSLASSSHDDDHLPRGTRGNRASADSSSSESDEASDDDDDDDDDDSEDEANPLMDYPPVSSLVRLREVVAQQEVYKESFLAFATREYVEAYERIAAEPCVRRATRMRDLLLGRLEARVSGGAFFEGGAASGAFFPYYPSEERDDIGDDNRENDLHRPGGGSRRRRRPKRAASGVAREVGPQAQSLFAPRDWWTNHTCRIDHLHAASEAIGNAIFREAESARAALRSRALRLAAPLFACLVLTAVVVAHAVRAFLDYKRVTDKRVQRLEHRRLRYRDLLARWAPLSSWMLDDDADGDDDASSQAASQQDDDVVAPGTGLGGPGRSRGLGGGVVDDAGRGIPHTYQPFGPTGPNR